MLRRTYFLFWLFFGLTIKICSSAIECPKHVTNLSPENKFIEIQKNRPETTFEDWFPQDNETERLLLIYKEIMSSLSKQFGIQYNSTEDTQCTRKTWEIGFSRSEVSEYNGKLWKVLICSNPSESILFFPTIQLNTLFRGIKTGESSIAKLGTCIYLKPTATILTDFQLEAYGLPLGFFAARESWKRQNPNNPDPFAVLSPVDMYAMCALIFNSDIYASDNLQYPTIVEFRQNSDEFFSNYVERTNSKFLTVMYNISELETYVTCKTPKGNYNVIFAYLVESPHTVYITLPIKDYIETDEESIPLNIFRSTVTSIAVLNKTPSL